MRLFVNTCVPQRVKSFSVNNNYTYIIASLPCLSTTFRPESGTVTQMLDWIKSQLGPLDRERVEFVQTGFNPEKLDRDFYIRAFSSKNRFIREFFGADLRLRNAKVRFLNAALGRPADKDTIAPENAPDGEDKKRIDGIFSAERNLVQRERMMDDFLWESADSLTLMSSFSLDNVLAITVKLCIIGRWLSLDEESGRQLLRQLVGQMRSNYGNIDFNTQI